MDILSWECVYHKQASKRNWNDSLGIGTIHWMQGYVDEDAAFGKQIARFFGFGEKKGDGDKADPER
jgi:hypothetical protein